MSVWAYRCYSCVEGEGDWFVSQVSAEGLGADVRIVRVRVGKDWKCALLDRSQRVAVERQLLRDVIASDETDCPECAEMLAAATSPAAEDSSSDSPDPRPSTAHIEQRKHAMKVQAAAISLQGRQFVVVLSPMTLVTAPGEADLAIDEMQPYFGGVPVVLMAQREDGSPNYYGDRDLVEMLDDVPVEKMLWKEYPVG